jgi:hypothetical protein
LAVGEAGMGMQGIGRLEEFLVFATAVLLGHPDLTSVTGED